jgi:hypothetical protein
MSREDFAKLVDEMAEFRLKYEEVQEELARLPGSRPPGVTRSGARPLGLPIT